jgi:hypothetical protein
LPSKYRPSSLLPIYTGFELAVGVLVNVPVLPVIYRMCNYLRTH